MEFSLSIDPDNKVVLVGVVERLETHLDGIRPINDVQVVILDIVMLDVLIEFAQHWNEYEHADHETMITIRNEIIMPTRTVMGLTIIIEPENHVVKLIQHAQLPSGEPIESVIILTPYDLRLLLGSLRGVSFNLERLIEIEDKHKHFKSSINNE